MREGELARVRDRVVGVARVDVLHRVGGARRGLDPLQGGSDRSLHALQYPLLGTPGAHREPRRLELQRLARLRSEEHTSELQSRGHLVCRLLLEKKKMQSPPCTMEPATTTSGPCVAGHILSH